MIQVVSASTEAEAEKLEKVHLSGTVLAVVPTGH